MGKEWKGLKSLASALSDALKHKNALGWTIVHGDCKSTNFMLSPDHACVGIDFQYIGGGYGARDLAMFIVCACEMEEDSLACGIDKETEVLELYYECLMETLSESTAGF